MRICVSKLPRTQFMWVLLAWLIALTSRAVAQESIELKNGLNSSITLLIQSAEQTSPTVISLRVDEAVKYPLKWKSPYTMQVIPDDKPRTGFHRDGIDLHAEARALAGAPYLLRGDFVKYVDRIGRVVGEVRVAVHVDIPTSVPGVAIRYPSPEMSYADQYAPGRLAAIEVEPTARTGVVNILVPANSKVTLDGVESQPTGELRIYNVAPLARGAKTTFRLKVEWEKDGHKCEITHDVEVRGGEVTRVYCKLFSPPPPPVILVPVQPIYPR